MFDDMAQDHHIEPIIFEGDADPIEETDLDMGRERPALEGLHTRARDL